MRKTIVMLSLALLAACTHGNKNDQTAQDVQIERYMTEQQLVGSMGKPDHVQKEGSLTVLVYRDRLLSMSADRSDYSFIFEGPPRRIHPWKGQGADPERHAKDYSGACLTVGSRAAEREVPFRCLTVRLPWPDRPLP